MRAYRFLVTLALFVVSLTAHAVIFQVRGTVAESGIAVPGLSVTVAHAGGSTRTAATDVAGLYRTTFNETIANGDLFSVTVSESGIQIGTGSAVYTTGTPFVAVNIAVTTAPPAISSFASSDGATIVNADSVILVGQTSEPNRGVTITRGDETFTTTTDGSGAFQVTTSLSQDAVNDFVAVVADEFGKTISASFSVVEDSTPPVISAPSNFQEILSGTTLVFSGGDGFLDGTPVSSGAFVSTPGSHTLRVRDAAGNEVTVSFSIRMPNPPTISGLSVEISGTSLVLAWTGSANFFTVFRDGLFLTTAFFLEYTDSSVTPGVTYSYRVLANRDGLEASQEATGLLPVSTPVSDVSVGTGDIQPGESIPIAAHGAPGVTGKVMLVDQGGNVLLEQTLSETSLGDYQGALSIPSNLPDGDYDIVVDVGGQKTTASGGVSVDSTPPSVPEPVVNDTPAIAGEPFIIQVTAEPGSIVTADVSGLNPTLGEVTFVETSPGNFETRVDLAGDAGSKSVPVTVTDKAGNTTESTLEVVIETPDTPVSDVVLGDGMGEVAAVQPGGLLPISVHGEPGESAMAELVDNATGVVVSSVILTETSSGEFVGDVTIPEGADATLDLRVTVGNQVTTKPGVVMIDGTPPPVGTSTEVPVSQGLRLVIPAEAGVRVIVLVQDFGSVPLEETTPGTFTGTFALDPAFSGQIPLVVTATDTAGNSTRIDKTVEVVPQVFSVTLNLHQGVNLMHVPVKEEELERLSDLYRRLGGAAFVSAIIALNEAGRFVAFTSMVSIGSRVDVELGGSAVIVVMKQAKQVVFSGLALPSEVAIRGGLSLIGVPRRQDGLRVSDIARSVGISVVIREEGGKFIASPPSDADIRGGQGFLVVATSPGILTFHGEMWPENAAMAAPFALPFNGMSEGELWYFLQMLEGETALLATPVTTTLLQNYPNPFNPETWIPFQLSEDADVRLTVYGLKGEIVCVLDLGFLPAGSYTERSRAAYWDGKNALGERVASGVYVCELHANSFVWRTRMALRQ